MSEQISTTIEKLKDLFQQRYNEEIDQATLTRTIEEYGSDRVEEVINNMKDDAYEPASFMQRSLKQGWYTSKPKTSDTDQSPPQRQTDYRARNTEATWDRMVKLNLCDREDADYMISVILNDAERDEKRIRDIHFRIRQGLYPKSPATWFHWLTFPENRQAANQWIKDNNVQDIPLYDI